ncbi:MAG: aminoacylase [Gammaproteobacteria bacterium]|nr:aminoacylase [Gammaproteobacteria bacterium]|tara:strand:+ start:9208 stop:10725 length:1518 start_codon:yes stop_codon:yes gene_type:complete
MPMKIKKFSKLTILIIVGLITALDLPANNESSFLIINARIIDGSGGPSRFESVRVNGNEIQALGQLKPQSGETIIDGTGLILSPGFIDTHSHHDGHIFDMPDALSAVSQGITTIVVGMDGGSEVPLSNFFNKLENDPVAINIASYSGHNSLRSIAMGKDYKRPSTQIELRSMADLLKQDMEDGALGLSTGLEYDPGLYSETDEVVDLLKIVSDYKGRYTSHMRSEDIYLEAALDEFIEISRRTKLPSQISHIKLARRGLWGQSPWMIDKLNRARLEGLDITADVYPYTFYESTMRILFAKRDFDNRESAEYALTELVHPEGLTLSHYGPDPSLIGKTIADIATQRGKDPATVLMDLIREDEEETDSAIGVAMSQPDVNRLMQWEHTNICSDGDLIDGHPRGRGAFARILAYYVRSQGILELETAIHKMTQLSALHMGFKNRGIIETGAIADLVLFNPKTIQDNATMENINKLSSGIAKVWIGGELVYSDKKSTGLRPGRVIRRVD